MFAKGSSQLLDCSHISDPDVSKINGLLAVLQCTICSSLEPSCVGINPM